MVTRTNVENTKAFIRPRLGNPYVYGGALSPTNVRQGTDCSEVCQTALEMAHGRYVPGRQSEGATTESYRYVPVGGIGPFGTVRVNNWRDIPANAAARIALHHGPGGGANSHMWMELDGMRIESGGSKGLVTGDRALAIENNYANAWCYLPGPISEDGGIPTLGIGSTGDAVRKLQERLNRDGAGLEVDGEYGELTAAAVRAAQQQLKVTADPAGVAGPATQKALALAPAQPVPPTPQPPLSAVGVLSRATGITAQKATQILPQVSQGLRDSQCNTVPRIAMWLAQIGLESDSFNATEEYDKNGRYAPYIGRTWIQITWRENYLKFSQWCHSKNLVNSPTYFVDHPKELAELRWAGLGPAWYWTVARTNINAMCDNPNREEALLGVTRAINGGTNGLEDHNGQPGRRTRYSRALALGSQLLELISDTGEDELPADTVAKINDLHALFFTETGSLSALRKPGEGNIGTLGRILKFMDANIHIPLMKDLAEVNHPQTLQELRAVADMDLSEYPDRGADSQLAQAILSDARDFRAAIKAINSGGKVAPTTSNDAMQAEIEVLRADRAELKRQLEDPNGVVPEWFRQGAAADMAQANATIGSLQAQLALAQAALETAKAERDLARTHVTVPVPDAEPAFEKTTSSYKLGTTEDNLSTGALMGQAFDAAQALQARRSELPPEVQKSIDAVLIVLQPESESK